MELKILGSSSKGNCYLLDNGNEAYELLNRPLHHSQKCLNETDNYADFEYTLCPTTDFRDYIIGRGTRMKVISPKWLADEIIYKHMEAAKAYMEE